MDKFFNSCAAFFAFLLVLLGANADVSSWLSFLILIVVIVGSTLLLIIGKTR